MWSQKSTTIPATNKRHLLFLMQKKQRNTWSVISGDKKWKFGIFQSHLSAMWILNKQQNRKKKHQINRETRAVNLNWIPYVSTKRNHSVDWADISHITCFLISFSIWNENYLTKTHRNDITIIDIIQQNVVCLSADVTDHPKSAAHDFLTLDIRHKRKKCRFQIMDKRAEHKNNKNSM